MLDPKSQNSSPMQMPLIKAGRLKQPRSSTFQGSSSFEELDTSLRNSLLIDDSHTCRMKLLSSLTNFGLNVSSSRTGIFSFNVCKPSTSFSKSHSYSTFSFCSPSFLSSNQWTRKKKSNFFFIQISVLMLPEVPLLRLLS